MLYDSKEFLIYSYFGFDFSDSAITMLQKIVEKAYKDAVNRGAFNNKQNKKYLASRKYFIHKSKAIHNVMDEIRKFNKYTNYRKWHEKLCLDTETIINNSNPISLWTYGNSQKLINMSVKYLLMVYDVVSSINSKHRFIDYSRYFAGINDELDIPIDNYVLDELFNDNYLCNNINFPLKSNKKPQTRQNVLEWSKWNKNDYNAVQINYHNAFSYINVIPIEWEHEHWIAIAKQKRK